MCRSLIIIGFTFLQVKANGWGTFYDKRNAAWDDHAAENCPNIIELQNRFNELDYILSQKGFRPISEGLRPSSPHSAILYDLESWRRGVDEHNRIKKELASRWSSETLSVAGKAVESAHKAGKIVWRAADELAHNGFAQSVAALGLVAVVAKVWHAKKC